MQEEKWDVWMLQEIFQKNCISGANGCIRRNIEDTFLGQISRTGNENMLCTTSPNKISKFSMKTLDLKMDMQFSRDEDHRNVSADGLHGFGIQN